MLITIIILSVVNICVTALLIRHMSLVRAWQDHTNELQKNIDILRLARHDERIKYLDDLIESEREKQLYINRSLDHINTIDNMVNLAKRQN
jgi:hypothetical protein